MTKNFKLYIHIQSVRVRWCCTVVHVYNVAIPIHIPELDIDEMLQSNINPNNLYRHEWQHTISAVCSPYMIPLPICVDRCILLLICIRWKVFIYLCCCTAERFVWFRTLRLYAAVESKVTLLDIHFLLYNFVYFRCGLGCTICSFVHHMKRNVFSERAFKLVFYMYCTCLAKFNL